MLLSPGDSLNSIMYLQFPVQRVEVRLYRMRADGKMIGDGIIRAALSQQGEQLTLLE